MRPGPPPPIAATIDGAALDAFVGLAGPAIWSARMAELARRARCGPRAGKAILQRHVVELGIDRLRAPWKRLPLPAEIRIGRLATALAEIADTLTRAGRERLRAALRSGLAGEATLIPLFHLARTARLQRDRGFAVEFAGLDEGAPFDLLIASGDSEAEIACDVVSAEEGRAVHRGAWFRLADRIDPDLHTWLAAHPGRYLLKMTLAQGLQGRLHDERREGDALAVLHERIRAMLEAESRSDQDAAVVLRLDPLLLTAARADELGLLSSLRREFGPEAHLSVTAGGDGVFVMAARAGRENAVAAAVRQRLAEIAPVRLTGTRPGILAMLVEDTDRAEWRTLRDGLELEGEARQFLTFPEARQVVAVTCASRIELFGLPEPDAAPDGELRFRNPAHPAAAIRALAPAVLSSA